MKKKAILILGMHRSGTSLVSSILDKLGVEFGSDLLGAMPKVNEKGFWESRLLVEAHEVLLSDLGRAWYDITPLPVDWLDSEAAQSFKQDMKAWIQEEFAYAPLFALKDPRMCLFVPLWQQIFEELDISARYLVIKRHPFEIALSLMKRDAIPPLYSLALTQYYLSSAWQCVEGKASFTINYSDVMQDWKGSFSDIAEHLHLDWDVCDADVGGLLDVNLRHHCFGDNLFDDLAEGIRNNTWESSKEATFVKSPELMSYLHRVGSIWQEKHAEHCYAQVIVAERDAQLSELTVELTSLGKEHEYAQVIVAERDVQLSELVAQLTSLGKEHEHAQVVVEERDAQLSELTAQLTSLGKEHEHAQVIVAERDAQLANIHSYMNRSWLGRWFMGRLVKNETTN